MRRRTTSAGVRAGLLAALALIGCGARAAPRDSAVASPSGPAVSTTSVDATPTAPASTAERLASVEFVVDEAFEIAGRGPVAMGRLTTGRVEVGDDLIVKHSEPPITVRVEAVEAIRKPGAAATAGQDMGLLLRLPAGVGVDVLGRGVLLVR